MDEQEKPFDTISIIVLLSLAVANDGAEIFFDVLASTMVGLPGESIMKPIDFAMDGIFTFWFFSKCGFGGPAIIQVADDLLELVGIPGRFICVAASIFMANHPKLAAVAEMAGAAALTGGAGAVAAEAGETAEVGVVAAESATAATEGAAVSGEVTTEAESVAEGGARGAVEETGNESKVSKEAPSGEEGEEAEEKKKKLEEEMEPEEERSPEDVLREKLLNQTPTSKEDEDEDDEDEEIKGREDEQNDQRSNLVSGADFQKRAEEIKRRQTGLPQAPKIIDVNEGRGDNLEKEAA